MDKNRDELNRSMEIYDAGNAFANDKVTGSESKFGLKSQIRDKL